jgi:hypothetical protein
MLIASIPAYLLCFIRFPKWAIRLPESEMAHYLWNSRNEYHIYHIASWQHVNMKKVYDGLGIPNLGKLNLC